MKALLGAFNQEKALVGVIVKTGCGTDGSICGTSEDVCHTTTVTERMIQVM